LTEAFLPVGPRLAAAVWPERASPEAERPEPALRSSAVQARPQLDPEVLPAAARPAWRLHPRHAEAHRRERQEDEPEPGLADERAPPLAWQRAGAPPAPADEAGRRQRARPAGEREHRRAGEQERLPEGGLAE
jgi:hypothetical protein